MGALLNGGRISQRANGRTGLVSLYSGLRRLGLGPLLVLTCLMPLAIIGNGWSKALRNLLTLSVDLHDMVGGPADHRADSGILRGGHFHAERLRRMLAFAKGGDVLTTDDVARFIAANAHEDPSRLGQLVSAIEFSTLLRVFGADVDAPGEHGLRLSVSTLVALYENGRLPTTWRPVRRTGLLNFLISTRALHVAASRAAVDRERVAA